MTVVPTGDKGCLNKALPSLAFVLPEQGTIHQVIGLSIATACLTHPLK